MTEAAKSGLLTTMRSIGLMSRIRDSRWRSSRLLILCYHGISQADEHQALPDLFMPPALFRQRMETLRDGKYNVVPLEEGLQRLAAGTLPPRSVAITFDDGFVDFHRLAWPILRDMAFPATVYVATQYAQHRLAVFPPILSYILWKGARRTASGVGLSWDDLPIKTFTEAERSATVASILRRLSAATDDSAESRDAAAAELARRLGVDYEEIRRGRLLHLMTPGEIDELQRDSVDVQLHTHRHVQPDVPELFAREIIENRAMLSNWGVSEGRLRHYCYPSGETRAELPGWLRDQGVVSATTCVPDLASPDDDAYLIPRFVDTQAVSQIKYEGWISGAAALLPKRKRAAHRSPTLVGQ